MFQYITRYGAMRLLGVFSFEGETLPMRTSVIIRTSRGLEAGLILCDATPERIAKLGDACEEDRVIRKMTKEDWTELRRIREEEKDKFARCQAIIRQMNLVMELVRIEHLFGGERIIVYYVAEDRVDFRELVKTLASEFQTRIEMRQIGVRDETKLLADYGDCGREVCCNSYLTEMPPVSMKMAKLQKATLDPTKISGRCGRLKCCLRYENDVYTEWQQNLPGIGCQVQTAEGPAGVFAHEILQQKIWLEFADQTRKLVPVEQVQLIEQPESEPRQSEPRTK